MSEINDLGLNPKQLRFAEEYVEKPNGTDAYKKAGYSPSSDDAAAASATRLLNTVKVQEAIRILREKRATRAEVNAARVLQELARLAFADPRKLYNPDGSLKQITELDDDTAATVSSVEVYEELAGQGEERKTVGFTKKLKHWDKNAALLNLAKHLGLLREKVEVTGKDGGPIEQRISWDAMFTKPDAANPIEARLREETLKLNGTNGKH
jgi:phage terminase small subunit